MLLSCPKGYTTDRGKTVYGSDCIWLKHIAQRASEFAERFMKYPG